MDRAQINLEFLFRASPAMIYRFLTNASEIVLWFCDGVDITGKTFTFEWDGSEEVAELVDSVEDEMVRWEFEDYEEGEYLEFKMTKSPMTKETILEITDYCDEDEVEDQKRLWESQIKKLRGAIGG